MVRLGKVIRDSFERAIGSAIIDAENSRAPQNTDIRFGFEFGCHLSGPLCRRQSVDDPLITQKTTAECRVFLGKNNARAGACRCTRSHQTSRTGANYENVTKECRFFVMIRIIKAGSLAEACCAPDHWLVELFPEDGGPHEGLVVEACSEKRRQE